MEPPAIAVYDANILYSAPLRDLFIRLAQAGLVRARWTDTIHDECVVPDRPGPGIAWDEKSVARFAA